ncbi:alpha-ketoglutarate-dependent dioxygenase AlkB-like domain-containing protein [Pseudoscourfieldia marina]
MRPSLRICARTQFAEQLPDYAIAFDVVFESRGNPVEWHCDYESLGPFVVPDRWAAVRDSHFMSVHFNLTEDGGALTTNSSVWLSPDGASTRRSNRALEGNVFDNTRLHKVIGGAPRTSYVVRLVRKGAVVLISKQSIADGIKRSQACMAFRSMLDCVDENASDAAEIDWARIPGVERERGASSVTGSLIWR